MILHPTLLKARRSATHILHDNHQMVIDQLTAKVLHNVRVLELRKEADLLEHRVHFDVLVLHLHLLDGHKGPAAVHPQMHGPEASSAQPADEAAHASTH